jgi:hypothetical protein
VLPYVSDVTSGQGIQQDLISLLEASDAEVRVGLAKTATRGGSAGSCQRPKRQPITFAVAICAMCSMFDLLIAGKKVVSDLYAY